MCSFPLETHLAHRFHIRCRVQPRWRKPQVEQQTTNVGTSMYRHASVNRIYRLVWSQASGSWVPVAETARGRGKRSCKSLIAVGLSLAAGITEAGPLGGQVVAGSGNIAQSGAITTITQASPKLSLTWASFNIAPQETVDFVQPSVS